MTKTTGIHGQFTSVESLKHHVEKRDGMEFRSEFTEPTNPGGHIREKAFFSRTFQSAGLEE